MALLAICVGRCADAHVKDWTTPDGAASTAAQVAQAARLDMREWWTVTGESYLGHVSNTMILDAVREGASASAAHRIAGMKKEPMVANAAELLAGTGWLPTKLRTPGDQPATHEVGHAAE